MPESGGQVTGGRNREHLRRASVDFEYSEKVQGLLTRLEGFMDEFVYPSERTYLEQHEADENWWKIPPNMDYLKNEAIAIVLLIWIL